MRRIEWGLDWGGHPKGALLELLRAIVACWLTLAASVVSAQTGLTTYGMPGHVEMPSAFVLPDAELAGTVGYFDRTTRSTLTFQATPRITTAFRYSGLENLGGSLRSTLFDRSFDVHIQLAKERGYRPAIAFGLRDFVGTGVYSGEYFVASKRVDNWAFTGGIGWGRLGGDGFAERRGPTASTNQGGQLESARWFTGEPALFGGVSWHANDGLQFSVEYSSDSYLQESDAGVLEQKSPLNVAVDWSIGRSTTLKGFYLHGSEIGLALHVKGNPARTRTPSGNHPGPVPVRRRDTLPANSEVDWQQDLLSLMAREGLDLVALAQTGTTMRVDVHNMTYGASAEALGRTTRILSRVLPDTIETFEIVNIDAGLTTSLIRVEREDVERLAFAVDGAEQLWRAVDIGEAPVANLPEYQSIRYPSFLWGFGPYTRASFFDPDRPVMFDLGLRFDAQVSFSRRLFLRGSVRKSLANNFSDSDQQSDSVLPKVRSESNRYMQEGDPALETLSLVYYFRPGDALYGRLSVGYLESQFAGLSTELLWKPVDSRLAVGLELNAVRQRAFDQGFDLRSYEVITGHASAYYAFENGLHVQVDAGRYLAGDWGATFSVDREFRNGWRIGAYATFTDVSFEDFGEGSFDKGFRFTIPLEPFLGRPTRRKYGVVLQPLTRDGGARLHVDGRLYEQVRDFHVHGLQANWGRVWR